MKEYEKMLKSRKEAMKIYGDSRTPRPILKIGMMEAYEAMDELVSELKAAELENLELKVKIGLRESKISTLESDLFHEKANGEIMANRAEVLESAIKESPDPCWFCANVNECPGDCEFDFDEAKFTKGVGKNDEQRGN